MQKYSGQVQTRQFCVQLIVLRACGNVILVTYVVLEFGATTPTFPCVQEDKDEVCNAMRSETKSLGLLDTTENCWATFINKVK